MKRTSACQSGVAAVVLLGILPLLIADGRPGAKPLTRQLQMSACYVKEDTDRAWHCRIVGNMPRGPGIYVIIYNEAGDVVHRTSVPYGAHTAEKPFIIDIPADGKAQQYVIKLLGQQDNLNAMTLPLTDLPHEVYGDSSFSFGGSAETHRRIVAFQVPVGNSSIHFSGWSGNYRILDENGATISDSKDKQLPAGDPAKKGGPRDVETIVTGLTPGKTYSLEPYSVMYLGVHNGKLYLTFDPERWFEPTLAWTLESRPWWKGLPHE